MKRAHDKLVPHTHSEKEFWEKFFNYEVARKVIQLSGMFFLL